MKDDDLVVSSQRNHRSAIISALFLVTWIAPSARAQSAVQVFRKYVKAIGGEQSLRQVTSWHARGTIIRRADGAAGRYEESGIRPNLYGCGRQIGESGFELGFNGKSGWQNDSRDGLQTLTGEASKGLADEASYRNHGWLKDKGLKSKLAYGGTATVQGRPAHVVVLSTDRNGKIKLYFDQESGLLLQDEMATGASVKTMQYSDYRKVTGVLEPFSVTLAQSGEAYEIKLDEVVHNPQLDKRLFNPPHISGEPLPDGPHCSRRSATIRMRSTACVRTTPTRKPSPTANWTGKGRRSRRKPVISRSRSIITVRLNA